MRLLYELAVKLLNAFVRFWQARDLTWKGQALKYARQCREEKEWVRDGRERREIAVFLLALSKHDSLMPEQQWALRVAFRAISRHYRAVPSTIDLVAKEIVNGGPIFKASDPRVEPS